MKQFTHQTLIFFRYILVFSLSFQLGCEDPIGLGPSADEQFVKLFGGDYSQQGIALVSMPGEEQFVLFGHGTSFSSGEQMDAFVVYTDALGEGISDRNPYVIENIFDFSESGEQRDEYAAEMLAVGEEVYLIGTTVLKDGDADAFLIHLDGNGTETFRMKYGDPSSDEVVHAATLLANGDLLLAGYTTDIDDQKSNYDLEVPQNSIGIELDSTDFWCLRLRPDGTEVWRKTFGLRGADKITAVLNSDEDIILAGTTDFPEIGEDLARDRDKDACLIRLNAAGSLIDFRRIGESESDESISGIDLTDTGELLLIGKSTATSGVEQVLLSSFTLQFEPILSPTTFSQSLPSEGQSILSLESGNWLMTATTANESRGATDIWLFQTDQSGSILWEQRFGSIESDSGSEAIVLSSGEIVMIGTIGFGKTPMMALIKTNEHGQLIQ